MDHLQKLLGQIRVGSFIAYVLMGDLVLFFTWFGMRAHISAAILIPVAIVIVVLLSLLFASVLAKLITQPIVMIWQAILHVSPTQHGVQAPQPDSLKLGRELVGSLITQVYQLASVAENVHASAEKQAKSLDTNFIANSLPLPLIVLTKNETILFVNQAAQAYLNLKAADMIGQNVYTLLDMAFEDNNTFDAWLANTKQQAVSASSSWERVRLNMPNQEKSYYFDLAAFYNKDNPDNVETMLVMFDHSDRYAKEERQMSFLALSVHELRTPLTLLRGYIEAFEEEIGDQLTPQLKDFMFKMNASAQQLAAFINNILNVARVDDDQLTLELHEEDWGRIIRSAANNLALRCQVRGITLEFSVAPNLPTVGCDSVSIYEVISNLVDNAIKYSGESKRIRINTYLTKDGLVETTVQDWGVGIPASIMPNLFTKFYRNHRNRSQIGGTGLGLYLAKALVSAQGGNIWVRSKEGEGSVFGFTVLPYTMLADEKKNSDNKDIVRGAHGWIKNHSLYRQ